MRKLLLIGGGLALIAAIILGGQQVIIRIKDKNGKVEEHSVPEGSTIEIIPVTPPVPKPETKQPVFTPLFNGNDLTGWVDKDGKAGNWKVVDGAITCSGPRDYLYTTRNDYGDFHLRAECKISDKGNSGIFFRAAKPVSEGNDYEAQINSTHFDAQKTGSLWGLVKFNDILIKPDAWFDYDVIAQGNHIQIFVDGKKTADYNEIRANKPTTGYFALQNMVPTPYFRKIEIRELKPGEKTEIKIATANKALLLIQQR